jgi:large subunit ribosomal protein L5
MYNIHHHAQHRSAMALQEVTNAFIRRMRGPLASNNTAWTAQCRRFASTETTQADIESSDFLTDQQVSQRQFDPAVNARRRRARLPKSRSVISNG